MAELRWITAFLDFPAKDFEPGKAFWRAVTGSGLSAPRGENDELATLVPRDGDPYLKVQRIIDGPGGVHLDLHTDDVPAFVEHAVACGATVEQPGDYVVMTSPGGFTFCVVVHPPKHSAAAARPSPVPWWGGASLVDQVCLDAPAPLVEDEWTFWAELTGWERRHGSRPEFDHLVRPSGQPLRLLLQRLDAGDGPVRAHLDLACTDRVAEVLRHQSLDATPLHHTEQWTTLRDPVGLEYCITDRDPATGTVAPVDA